MKYEFCKLLHVTLLFIIELFSCLYLLDNHNGFNTVKFEKIIIYIYIIIRVHPAFSLVASCVSLKCTRTDDVN